MSNKTWIFTLNNWEEKQLEMIRKWEKTYLCMGKEGKDKTKHIQGYITFKRNYRLKQLKKLLPEAHWEIAKVKDGMNYCMKEGDYEIEDNRKQGKRTDLENVSIKIKEGKNEKEIFEDHPIEYLKYHNGINKAINLKVKGRTSKPTVRWIYGPTGSGKTRSVFDKYETEDIWVSGKDLKYWEGYNGQQVVLLDDFRKDFCTFHELLRILDRYPYRVNIKYGSRELTSTYIYITTPFRPEELYETREDIGQLLRRIDDIIEMRLETETEVERGNTDSLHKITYDDILNLDRLVPRRSVNTLNK